MIETLAIANAITLRNAEEFVPRSINDNYRNSNSDHSDGEGPTDSSTMIVGNINDGVIKQSEFQIEKRFEVSKMAELFLGPWGQRGFTLVMIVYLYGDLSIYAVSVPKSILQVSGAWMDLPPTHVFYFYLGGFAILLVPLTFFDFQKTRYLQITTMVIRNLSLFGMIIIATMYDVGGEGKIPNSWFDWEGFPDIFGVSIYAFMCHHSLPSIITPIKNQKRVKLMMMLDSLFVLVTYLLLCWTALWAFGAVKNPTCDTQPGPPCTLQKLYTMNFASYAVKPIGIFLVLFPVFTLSTNFPLIAITLRNNLMQLITYKEDSMNPRLRQTIFALIAVLPPIAISFLTQDIAILVDITGAYAGLGIMFFFPTLLVFYARKLAVKKLGKNANASNFLASPFSHVAWVYFIFVWCILALGGTVYRQIWINIPH